MLIFANFRLLDIVLGTVTTSLPGIDGICRQQLVYVRGNDDVYSGRSLGLPASQAANRKPEQWTQNMYRGTDLRTRIVHLPHHVHFVVLLSPRLCCKGHVPSLWQGGLDLSNFR